MTVAVDPVLKARSNLAVAHRATKNTPPERLGELRAELAAAKIERAIREAVEAAPPLTDEQRARLAAILTGGAR